MESKNRNGLTAVVIALIASVTVIASVLIFTKEFVGYKKTANGSGLSATGSASSDFESDLIVWRGSFSASGTTTGEAYEVIKKDTELVRDYLLDSASGPNTMRTGTMCAITRTAMICIRT